MKYEKILLSLEMIEAELDDASNQLPEYNANSDALTSIDCAKNELYCLKDDIEKAIITDKKLDPIDRFNDEDEDIIGWEFAGKTYTNKEDAPISDPRPIRK